MDRFNIAVFYDGLDIVPIFFGMRMSWFDTIHTQGRSPNIRLKNPFVDDTMWLLYLIDSLQHAQIPQAP